MANEYRTHQVSLGCGTLILIALIVLFFSGRNTAELEREIQSLRSEVSELKKSVDTQTDQIIRLERKLDEKP